MSIILDAAAKKLGISPLEVFYKAAVANCYIDAPKISNEWIQTFQSFREIPVDVCDFCLAVLQKEDKE
jgi:hypothetical protein